MDFYKTEKSAEDDDTAWSRLLNQDGIHGLGARRDGELVGMAHDYFHTAVWAQTVCYLQDLFVLPTQRGQGVNRSGSLASDQSPVILRSFTITA